MDVMNLPATYRIWLHPWKCTPHTKFNRVESKHLLKLMIAIASQLSCNGFDVTNFSLPDLSILSAYVPLPAYLFTSPTSCPLYLLSATNSLLLFLALNFNIHSPCRPQPFWLIFRPFLLYPLQLFWMKFLCNKLVASPRKNWKKLAQSNAIFSQCLFRLSYLLLQQQNMNEPHEVNLCSKRIHSLLWHVIKIVIYSST